MDMTKRRVGLLVMAYGSPRNEDEIEAYYTHIRGGRKPTVEMVESLKERYQAIGGVSPLSQITDLQVEALSKTLNEAQTDITFVSYLGLKHASPFIEGAVAQMHADGIREAVSIVMAPHYSTLSVANYHARAASYGNGQLTISGVDSWHIEEKFIAYWQQALHEVFSEIPNEEHEQAVVIFSAHSLPERIKHCDDPYEEQVMETAGLIVAQGKIANYAVCWQSAGKSPEPWLGPDVLDCTRALHEAKKYKHFIYAPVGFVADHLEVLYDNDVECRELVEELGAYYHRAAMPNVDKLFIHGLADAVLAKVEEGWI